MTLLYQHVGGKKYYMKYLSINNHTSKQCDDDSSIKIDSISSKTSFKTWKDNQQERSEGLNAILSYEVG